jgi:hypothetical protein
MMVNILEEPIIWIVCLARSVTRACVGCIDPVDIEKYTSQLVIGVLALRFKNK